MTQTSKKHHYIPQFYVGNFANSKGNVFVLEHETGKINEQTKNGTFHKYKFYTMDLTKHEKRDPEKAERIKKSLGIENVDTSKVKEHPDMVENLLGDSENLASSIIRKLVDRVHISVLEKAELSMFMALMYTRNPAFHKFVEKMEKQMMDHHLKKLASSKDKAKAIYDELVKEGKEMKVSFEKVFEIFEKNRYKIEIPKELNIQNMLMVAPIIDTILQNKTWLILEAPSDSSFITNDSPVFLEHPNVYNSGAFGAGFETPGVKVFFPLSKESLLVMFDTPNNGNIAHKKIDKVGVRKFNQLIFTRSNNYVIARDYALLERLKK